MIGGESESALRKTARTLAEIAHTLDTTDDSDARVRRVLELLQQIVPYDQCALLSAPLGGDNELYVTPELPNDERSRLLPSLLGLVHLLSDAAHERPGAEIPHGLALPVMGLDHVVGVVRVMRGVVRVTQGGVEPYEVHHVALLSVVAGQLGAYLSLVRLQKEERKRTLEIAASRDFLQLLTGIVSHDIRNPLGVISTAASLLEDMSDDPRKTRTLRKIVSASDAAARIVNDLVDVTRARTAGVLPVARRHVDLQEVLSEVVEDVRLSHGGREIRFNVQPEGRVFGEWDPDRVSQVVLNLLNNALEHSPVGNPVRLDCFARDADVILSVHNDGPPIAPDLLPFVFDPFRSGKQLAARRKNLGLGLFIVAQIVGAHGGRVEATSDEQRGTTFVVVLPRGPQAQAGHSGSRRAEEG